MPFTGSIGPLELVIISALVFGAIVILKIASKLRQTNRPSEGWLSPVSNTPEGTREKKTPDERKEALAEAVQSAFARGYRVESQTNYQAIVVSGKPVNHILHLLLSLFTVGIWVLVWIGLAISGGEKRELISVDEYGNVSYS